MNGNSYDFQEIFNQTFFKKVNFINENKIFNELQNNRKILVLDFRSRSEFNEGHCDNSINIPSDEVEIENLFNMNENFLCTFTNGDPYLQTLLSKHKRLFIAIVCSQQKIPKKKFLIENQCNTNEDLSVAKVLLLYRSLINNKIREIGIYIKGYKQYEESYGFLKMHQTTKPK